jgi:hypothetical protein
MGRSPTGPGSGTTVGGASGATTSALVGTWRRVETLRTTMDITTTETTWTFSAGGGCQRTVTTSQVSVGTPFTTTSTCTYTLRGSTVSIAYDGTTGTVSFSVAVSGSTLLLNGVPFNRA